MADFSSEEYFTKRAAQDLNTPVGYGNKDDAAVMESKYDSLMKASAEKSAALNALGEQRKRNRNAWANQDGLIQDIVPRDIIDGAAHLYSGGSTTAGFIAGAVPNLIAAGTLLGRSDEQVQAYGRYKQGIAKPEDIALLNTPTSIFSKGAVDGEPSGATPLELFQREEEWRDTGRNINGFFDISEITDKTQQEGLTASIGKDFDTNWADTKQGFKKALQGNVFGAVDASKGIAEILFNAGEAVLNNKTGAAHYALENIPQLALGLFGKLGQAGLAASNVGYAADTFTKGIQNYQKDHNGELPSLEERQTMARDAASLAAAEQVGDVLSLGFMKNAGDAARTGFKNSLKEVSKATGKGIGSEGATEGYQTYAEGEVTQRPASAKEIFTGGVIGGVVGGVLSGGGRAIAEGAKAQPEQAEKQERSTPAKEEFIKAAETGDVSGLLDPKAPSYSPVAAVAALYKHSQQEGTSEEAKAQNLSKVNEILTGLEEKKAKEEEFLATSSPQAVEGIKQKIEEAKTLQADIDPANVEALAQSNQFISDLELDVKDIETELAKNPNKPAQRQAKIDGLTRDINEARKLADNLNTRVKPKSEDIDSLVEQASLVPDAKDTPAVEASRKATERVFSLAMAHPDQFSDSALEKLAGNPNAHLSTGQVSYLRAISAARIAENRAKGLSGVSAEVMQGDPTKGQLGIPQYKQRITQAITGANQKVADRYLGLLDRFATNHQAKSDLFTSLLEDAKKTGKETQVLPVKDGGWEVADRVYSPEELEKLGGLLIHRNSGNMVGAVQSEADALAKTHESLDASYQLKFTNSVSKQSPSAVVNSVSTKDPLQSTEVDSTVNSVEQSTKSQQAPAEPTKETKQDAAPSVEELPSTNEANGTEAIQESTEDVVQESNTTTQSNESTEVKPSGVLTKFAEVKETLKDKLGEVYYKINLAKEFLIQSAGNSNEETKQRPLVLVENFMSEWMRGDLNPLDYVDTKNINLEKAQALLKDFEQRMFKWLPNIQANLVKGKIVDGWKVDPKTGKKYKEESSIEDNSDFYANDPLQYFIHLNEQGKADLEENIKTAIGAAAYAFVAENANGISTHTRDAVKEMFGIAEYEDISDELYHEIFNKGTLEKVIINALGQRVIQALGFKETSKATVDFLPKLASVIGAHALHLLLDQGIVERSLVDPKIIAAGLPDSKSDLVTGGQVGFIRFIRAEGKTYQERTLNDKAEEIATLAKGTNGVFNKLFGVESDLIAPTWEPTKASQKTTKNTDQKVPALGKEFLDAEDQVPSHIREDMWNLFNGMDRESFLSINGFEKENPSTMHITKIEANQAKNDALEREYDRTNEYFGFVEQNAPGGLKQALYFLHSMWKQQRVGIATNMVNPQTSKMQRSMLYRPEWESKVSSNDLENFYLRVSEGLGVKTDKQGNTQSLEDVKAKLLDPVLIKAVEVLRKSLGSKDRLSAQDQQAVVDGVKFGGEKMHSLDALVALAHYENAKAAAKGKPYTFKVQMMGEVDGVTNGPMLSHLVMGAALNADELYELLNKGGFFRAADGEVNYNVYRSKAGRKDLYETTISHVLDNVFAMANKDKGMGALLPSLWAITGNLRDENTGKVEKAGRNIIKTPLTAMVFGSSVNGAIDSMFQDFVGKIYDGFEELAKLDPKEQDAKRKEYLTHLNLLMRAGKPGVAVSLDLSIKDLLGDRFGKSHLDALEKVFKNTLGKAVKTTMKEDFKTFMDSRADVNNAAQASFALADAARQGIKANYINELMDSGDIAFTEKDGKRIPAKHDLTKAQQKELNKRLGELNPVAHTYMSKHSGQDLASGLHVSKSSRKLSQSPAYKATVRFGRKNSNVGYSMLVTAYERFLAAPGVAMMPMMMHSLDSAISHMAALGTQVLNIHDAHGSGLEHFIRTAQNLNKATWKAALGYSPATEMRNTWVRTLEGMNALIKSGQDMEVVKAQLLENLKELGQRLGTYQDGAKVPMDMDVILQTITTKSFNTAYFADKTKLEAMQQMAAIDQYALEGGQYEVTTEDRAEASKLLSELVYGAPKDVDTLVDSINEFLGFNAQEDTKQKEETAPEVRPDPNVTSNAWGDLGEARLKSNPSLVAWLKANPLTDASKLIKMLIANVKESEDARLNDFTKQLMGALNGTLTSKIQVHFIEKDTPKPEDADVVKNALGWYSTKGDGHIYILGPEYASSDVNVTLLLHELTHGALAKIIDRELAAKEADAKYTSDALSLVEELETLRQKAVKFIQKNTQYIIFAKALVDVHELVSYGMTNSVFRDEVLGAVTMQSTTSGNKLVKRAKAFLEIIKEILFRNFSKSHQARAVNGLTILAKSVSGLFQQAIDTKGTIYTGSDKLHPQMQSVMDYSSIDIYEALGSNQTAHDSVLRNLLDSISNKLHGPFGTFKAARMENQAITANDVWLKAKNEGAAPFASKILASGLVLTEQETFVMDQIEVTINAGLNDNITGTHDVYTELSKLFREARSKIQASDFNTGDPVEDQRLYDFIFSTEGDKAAFLSRFAALGLAHEGFNKLLQFDTSRTQPTAEKSLIKRLENVFQRILDWFNGKITHTYAGQVAGEKLNTLVDQLIDIEAKRKAMILEPVKPSLMAPIETGMANLTAGARKKVEQFGKSQFFQNSKNGAVQGVGALISTVAGDRVDMFMEGLMKLRDEQFRTGHGMFAGLINEIRGANKGNQPFYTLLQLMKRREGIREDVIVNTSNVALESFDENGDYLTKEHKEGISAVFLRTDMSSLLDHMSMVEIQTMLNNPSYRDKKIADIEKQLAQFKGFEHYFINQSKILGYFKATGRVRGTFMMMNARNIANLVGTGKTISEADAAKAEVLIDQLVTLRAVQYTKQAHINNAREVLNREAKRGNSSGVEMVLKLHKDLQKQSKERLFKDSEALMAKGYTPEIYNPHREVLVADAIEGVELEAMGFVKGAAVMADPNDPDQVQRHLYVREGGGLRSYLTGIFSYTGKNAKGSRSKTGNVKTLAEWKSNQNDLLSMHIGKQAGIRNLFNANAVVDPVTVKQTYAAPVLDPNGGVVDYRYLMEENTKDSLLRRDNRFEKVLGTLAGSIFDKETTKEANHNAVTALHEQYLAEFADKHVSYVTLGPSSTDPKLREIYDMLPEDTKQSIRKVWGQDDMEVRIDLLDINFGYRKSSLTDAFNKEHKNFMEKVFVDLMTHLMGKKAEYNIRRAEDIWQELVHETKDILVVKNVVTLMGNISSNVSLLYAYGVPWSDALHHHRVAMKGIIAYRKDSASLAALEIKLAAGHTQGNEVAMRKEVQRLQDAISHNPVKELIDAGLMPTIVEDVSPENDIYSYKAGLVNKLNQNTVWMNPQIKEATKFIYMGKDTKAYQVLSHATQISDFVARYTLYQHMVNRKVKPMDKAAATQLASDAFINYDVPSHRTLQYLNDMGIVWFTKYYLRIQKVIAHLYEDAPSRMIMLLSLNHYVSSASLIVDSSMWNHIRNPLSAGALKYPGTLDELATVKLAMSPFN